MIKEQSVQDHDVSAANTDARKKRERQVAKFLMREGARSRSADDNARRFTAVFKASSDHQELLNQHHETSGDYHSLIRGDNFAPSSLIS